MHDYGPQLTICLLTLVLTAQATFLLEHKQTSEHTQLKTILILVAKWPVWNYCG